MKSQKFVYPFIFHEGKLGEEVNPGLTERKYFAAAALTGILASYAVPGVNVPDPKVAVKMAYEYADEMIKQNP